MATGASRQVRWYKLVAVAAVFCPSLAVYARTAYPTVTWWDSAPYSLAAVTLGITTPPGSLLLTLAGWIVTRLPSGLSPAYTLNVFAGALAAVTVSLVFVNALRLLRGSSNAQPNSARPDAVEPASVGPGSAGPAIVGPGSVRSANFAGAGVTRTGVGQAGVAPVSVRAIAGTALGALTLAFSETFWQYAVQFTPYVLTTVVTGLLLWCMLRWWERAEDPGAWRWLFLIGLVFGLDFSVHRTNLLLLPGFFVWILIRHPRTLRSARAWLSGASGLLVGLAFHLLIIPIAAADPTLNAGDPGNWSRFYEYVSLAQYGGGFLVQLYPRNGPLWSVQAVDLIRALGANFLWFSGRFGMLGILPATFALLGLYFLWRRSRRLAVAFAALLVVHAVVTVAYFNIPEHFFRSLYRHYLPVLVVWAVLIAYGMGECGARLGRGRWLGDWRAKGWSVILLAVVPFSQVARNWRAADGSRRYFTEDFATNLLNGLPKRSIIFTAGDNDTWPLLYMREVGHVRPDVQIVNFSLMNATWYLDQLVRKDRSFPFSPIGLDDRVVRPWVDTTLMIPVAGSAANFGLPDDVVLPDSIALRASPTMDGKYVLRQDVALLSILKENRWRRPLCFATTAGEQSLAWLKPYLRLEGLSWCLVPIADPPVNPGVLRRHLLETYVYRGYAATDLPLDEVSQQLGRLYYHPFAELAQSEQKNGDLGGCRASRERALRVLPLARLRPESALRQSLDSLCHPD